MGADAEAVLSAYYQALRRNDDRNSARTTIRMLESLVRISQVSAIQQQLLDPSLDPFEKMMAPLNLGPPPAALVLTFGRPTQGSWRMPRSSRTMRWWLSWWWRPVRTASW